MATTTYGTEYVQSSDLVSNWPGSSLSVANRIDDVSLKGNGLNNQTGSSYTLVLADGGKIVTLNNASAVSVTIPTNASVAFPTGVVIGFTNKGAGTVTLAGAGGVTVNGASLTLAQNESARALKLDTNTWQVSKSGIGKILQIVRATDTTDRSTTSGSFVDVTGMTVTISPTKSDSTVIVVATFFARSNIASTNNTTTARYALTDNSNNTLSGAEFSQISDSSAGQTNVQMDVPLTIIGYSTPATTSATTYKLRFMAVQATSTAYVQNASQTGQMYAIEVSA